MSVSVGKLCSWSRAPRRTSGYKPTTAPPKIDPAFTDPIKAVTEKDPASVTETSPGC